ncbi:MAG: hypothetical protein WBD73_06750 [Candidatus Acidiferrales bacterium]
MFYLALRRRLLGLLPFFTLYLGLVVADEALLWLTYRLVGIRSRISFDVYWTSQALLVLARAAVVYEICRLLLRPYAGIWKLCRPRLVGLGLILLASAMAMSRRTVHPISATTLMADRGLELTVVGVLLFGLIFCRYYGIEIPQHLAWIALGFGFYSAIQVANNTFLGDWLTQQHLLIWAALRRASFNIAILFWLVALWKPFPATAPAPVLLARGDYEFLAPQVSGRLRELNARLLEIWK